MNFSLGRARQQTAGVRLAALLSAFALLSGCTTAVAPGGLDVVVPADPPSSSASEEPGQATPSQDAPDSPADPGEAPSADPTATESQAPPAGEDDAPGDEEPAVVVDVDAPGAEEAQEQAEQAEQAEKEQKVQSPALVALLALPVKGRAPKTGYSRDEFGRGWLDPDRNGCDARNDILRRDLTATTYKAGSQDCVVQTGVLADPFSGDQIEFERGQATSSLVQIDHVVALSNAWQTGAQKWTPEERAGFANDPLNLIAVQGRLNAQKGDGDAATWLPPNKAFRCDYVARQIGVKAKWGGWVTKAERSAMQTVLATCPAQGLPAGSADARVLGKGSTANPAAKKVTASSDATSSGSKSAAKPKPTPKAPAPSNVWFKNCTAARDAGAAPVLAGDPGYAKHLDRDGDGVGCE